MRRPEITPINCHPFRGMARCILLLTYCTLIVVCQQQQLHLASDNGTLANSTGKANMTIDSVASVNGTLANSTGKANMTIDSVGSVNGTLANSTGKANMTIDSVASDNGTLDNSTGKANMTIDSVGSVNGTLANSTGKANMTIDSVASVNGTIAACSRHKDISNVSSIFKRSVQKIQLKPFYVIPVSGLQSLMDDFFTEANKMMGRKANLTHEDYWELGKDQEHMFTDIFFIKGMFEHPCRTNNRDIAAFDFLPLLVEQAMFIDARRHQGRHVGIHGAQARNIVSARAKSKYKHLPLLINCVGPHDNLIAFFYGRAIPNLYVVQVDKWEKKFLRGNHRQLFVPYSHHTSLIKSGPPQFFSSKYLDFFHVGALSHGRQSKYNQTSDLRAAIADLHRISNRSSIRYIHNSKIRVSKSNEQRTKGLWLNNRMSQHEFEHQIRGSTFCFATEGDSPTSRKLYDAIGAGCIPVILGDTFLLPFSSVLNYSAFSIIVSEKEFGINPISVGKRLLSSTPEYLTYLRENLILASEYLLYAWKEHVHTHDSKNNSVEIHRTNLIDLAIHAFLEEVRTTKK